jgi:3alpha(or 20beta)-hydroxysteroid dehydrogenase
MPGRLQDKVAVITGGARGQGAAEGALFTAEGAVVYLTDVRAEEGEKAAAVTGATFLEHDVTSPARWREVVDHVVAQHGRLDVLVNNAGSRRGSGSSP